MSEVSRIVFVIIFGPKKFQISSKEAPKKFRRSSKEVPKKFQRSSKEFSKKFQRSFKEIVRSWPAISLSPMGLPGLPGLPGLLQCTRSSHVDSGGAYGSAVFGGKGVMSMGKFVHFSLSLHWYKCFCSTMKFGDSQDRATIPPSSLAGGRRATEQNLRCSLYILESV